MTSKSGKFELDLSESGDNQDKGVPLNASGGAGGNGSSVNPPGNSTEDLQDHAKIGGSTKSLEARARSSAAASSMNGSRLAAALEEGGYQPVILFGNASSGKTSLLLSLFATIKTLPGLKTNLELAPDVIKSDSEYARYSLENAERFLNLMTQQFINGQAPDATAIEVPFLIPVTFEPAGKPPMRFVFIESNGEWYRPDYTDSRLFPKFRTEIEDLIRNCQRGILFLHLLPQTQLAVRGGNYDQNEDVALMNDASLAVAGALQNYRELRIVKDQDFHLMLVTKWDSRSKDMNMLDALDDDYDDVVEFVSLKYGQAYASYQNMSSLVREHSMNGFCAGLMNEDGILSLRPDNDLRPHVLRYPKNLWTWLYRSALLNHDIMKTDPFPAERSEGILSRIIHKLVG